MPVGILGPGIKTPIRDGNFALGVPNKDWTRIACPDAVCRPLVKADVVEIGVSTLKNAGGAALFFLILHKYVHTFLRREQAHDFSIEPRNRLEFAWPVFRIVRPCKPGGFMGLPFGGHAVAELARCSIGHAYLPSPKSESRKRLVIGEYASIRRSRRNGQLRRVSSSSAVSISPIRISSSVCDALAMIRPKGSARKLPPQNSSPGPLARLPRISPLSCPTRFTPAT